MATKPIDLDALAAKLIAAGFVTKRHPSHLYGGSKLFARKSMSAVIVYPDGRLQVGVQPIAEEHLEAFAIIRRHVSPVADPAPPAGLLAAARAVIDNAVIVEGNPPLFAHGARYEVPVAQIDALRRAVEAAPEPDPVALTDDERSELIIAATEGRHYAGLMSDAVDAVIAKLDELGFELRRRA